MPRIEQIRISVARNGENAENWRVEEGSSIQEVLESELCVNPAKFAIYVNGSQIDDLGRTLADGDQISLQPRNYSSGC